MVAHLSSRLRCVLTALVCCGSAASAEPVDFAKDIQPLIARKCLHCHGPSHQEGGLRLDGPGAVGAKLESGEVGIVAGKPDHSEVMKRVLSDDESVRMPPKAKPLSEREAALLKAWIEQGAKWESHWAFEAPQPQTPPEVKDKNWIKNPIDNFILAPLEAQGLSPAKPAAREALIRRVYFDLTGLPPTPEEVQAFVKDRAPNAYEKIVDKLLASPHFGERWARHWLDVVRYAETNSFERDGPKPHVWRYRDYVIRAFNEDKPYDQFLKEQLAGDEMPDPTADAIVATGLYRLGLWDDEPADRLQAKYDGFDDIVTTVGQGFLGLTFNCARCHDHKIDPITAKDYYSLVAFFHNITGMGNDGPNIERPILVGPDGKAKYEAAKAAHQKKQDDLQAKLTAIEQDFRAKFNAGDDDKGGSDLEDLEYRFYRDTFDKLPDFDLLKAETVDKLPKNVLDISVATRESFFGFVFTGVLKVPADGDYTFTLDSDDGAKLLIDGKEVLKYDGIHGGGSPKQATVALKQGRRAIRLDYFQAHGGKGIDITWTGADFKRRPLSVLDGASNDFASGRRVRGQGRDFKLLIKTEGEKLLGKQKTKEYAALAKQLDDLKRKPSATDMALCVTESGKQAPATFILARGSPNSPAGEVKPSFPTMLGGGDANIVPPTDANSTGRRTALANWIASPNNLLTSRVIVNRLWQHHFGRGIVRSPNNFGLLGDPPTHRELLDWLAIELVKGDWKLKPLHKTIVMSNAYQMSCEPSADALAKDPANNLFQRFNPRRLGAEELRDTIYVVNGSFNTKMYGPPIYPEISAEVLAGQSIPGKGWGKSTPEEEARRSVYIHVKRSLVTPILAVFDFPDSDISCEARFNTIQPGQSLALLNGDFANKQAGVLAKRLEKDAGGSVSKQVARAIELALSRPATPQDIERGLKLIEQLQEKHGQSPSEALRNYCLTVFNLNEFLYLD